MKNTAIREKAKKLGINSERMKTPELIHAIQRAEGNTPCFGLAKDNHCTYSDCFRKDCLD